MKPTIQAFTLIALGLAISARPVQGQTMSFFRQFTAPGMNRATGVAADESGIYVVGTRFQPSAGLRKYDSRGNELWTREFTAPTPGSVWLGPPAADATGVYVVGDVGPDAIPFLRKYDRDGNELWTRQLEVLWRGVAADATGVYVAGETTPPPFCASTVRMAPSYGRGDSEISKPRPGSPWMPQAFTSR